MRVLDPSWAGVEPVDEPADWRDEESRAAGLRYVEIRAALWRSLLAFTPAVEPLCALARVALPRELCPDAALDRLIAAARARARHDGLAQRGELELARRAAAERLGPADPDELLGDWILADMTSRELGEGDGLTLKIPLTWRTRPRFVQHLAVVRLNRYALAAARSALTADEGRVLDLARVIDETAAPLARRVELGRLGLRRAVGRFDPRHGVRFSVCAAWWICRTIRAGLGSPPRDAAAQLRELRGEFLALHGRPPIDEELVGLTGLSHERIRRLAPAGGAEAGPAPEEPASASEAPIYEDPAIERMRAYLCGRDSPG